MSQSGNHDLGSATAASDEDAANAAALELLKQLITLSSGVLVVSATFVEKFTGAAPWLLAILGLSWVLLVLSVYNGLQSMSAIVKRITHPDFEFNRRHVRRYARYSKYLFLIGIGLFVTFAFLLLLTTGGSPLPATVAGTPG